MSTGSITNYMGDYWLEDDQPLDGLTRRFTTYEGLRDTMVRSMMKNGKDRQRVFEEQDYDEELKEQMDEHGEIQFEEGREYKGWELEAMANAILRNDTKRELCRRCDGYGEETGQIESQPQYKDEGQTKPVLDAEGNQLYVDFPELECENGHRWYKGEGKSRTNGGDNPILFEEHLKNRMRREIYTSIGTPDPEIVSGIYNRVHPQGRKVNSEEQRKRHGASFYR